MNEAMAAAGKDKRNKVLKAVFQESFIQLLEIMISSEFDDKKFEKLYQIATNMHELIYHSGHDLHINSI